MLAPHTNENKTHTIDLFFLALAKLPDYGDSDNKKLVCPRFPILISQ